MTDTPELLDDELRKLRFVRETPDLMNQLQTLCGSELSIQQKLRSQFGADVVPFAIALNETRLKAAKLLPCADELWLTRIGLEQATDWLVAQYKAKRFPVAEPVVDLCSGIGVDAAALLNRGPVCSVEISAAMAERCRWNIDVWRQHNRISTSFEFTQKVADARETDIRGTLLHADPDRRDGFDRPVKRLEQYCPDLAWMQNVVRTAAGGALKLSPASNFIQKFPDCQTELISLNGECREATIWFGSLAEDKPYRATVLPTGESVAADPLSSWCAVVDEPGQYVLDPDPAVVRSGLIDVVGQMHNMQRLDSEDEYLTADEIPDTAFARAFRVVAVMNNQLRDLKRYFRALPARNYEVKCRHLHVDASAIQKKLPRGDGDPRVVLFARVNGKARIIVAERV